MLGLDLASKHELTTEEPWTIGKFRNGNHILWVYAAHKRVESLSITINLMDVNKQTKKTTDNSET